MTTGLCSCLRKTFHPTVRTKLNWCQWKKTWNGFLNKGAFSCTYLRGRLQVRARTVASTCMSGCTYLQLWKQIFVGSDAVHCDGGCSALRGRLQCTAGKVALHCVLDRLINSKMHQSIWGDVPQWSENLKVMYRLTDYME